MKEPVFVTHGQGPFHNSRKATLQLDLAKISGKSILVKPNIGRNTNAANGINTHPEAIAGVISALLDLGAAKIAIGESPILGVNIQATYRRMGIDRIAERYGCELIDLDALPPIVKNIPKGRVLNKTKLCQRIYDFDTKLSLPVAKMHMHTGVTLGIKNMKGCLFKKEKVRYHQLDMPHGLECQEKTLDLAIADLATILIPDITVIDGFIGLEGLGPSGGDPVLSDFCVASYNALHADTIACKMMGHDARDIDHLRLVGEYYEHNLDSEQIRVIPKNYLKAGSYYQNVPANLSLHYPDVSLCDVDSCSACLSTVMFFLKRFKSDMGQYIDEDGMLNLAIGKGVKEEDVNSKTIFIGNCAKNHSHLGTYVKGCPPVPTRIYRQITGQEPQTNEPEVE